MNLYEFLDRLITSYPLYKSVTLVFLMGAGGVTGFVVTRGAYTLFIKKVLSEPSKNTPSTSTDVLKEIEIKLNSIELLLKTHKEVNDTKLSQLLDLIKEVKETIMKFREYFDTSNKEIRSSLNNIEDRIREISWRGDE